MPTLAEALDEISNNNGNYYVITPNFDFDNVEADLLFEDARIVKTTEFNLLCAGVIQAALVIATKREGKLPVTIKICIISGTKEACRSESFETYLIGINKK